MHTFSFIVGNIIPKSVKWFHSATKLPKMLNPKPPDRSVLGFRVLGFRDHEESRSQEASRCTPAALEDGT